MASAGGRSQPGVIDALVGSPASFDFHQAVRLVEAYARELAREHGAAARQPVGYDHAIEREVVRFRVPSSLAFPAGDVLGVRLGSDTPPADGDGDATSAREPFAELTLAFLGLIGPAGVLPQHYTEAVAKRAQLKDVGLRDFLDLIHHRAASLYFRAWRKYRFPYAYEHALRSGAREDLFTWCVSCLVGMGTRHLAGRLSVGDASEVYFAGHFAHQPRSAAGLASMLSEYFDFPVRVEQFRGQWLEMPVADRTRLSSSPRGANNALGAGFALGARVWDVSSKLRVHAGPLTYAQFERLMPGHEGRRKLSELLRTYLGVGIDFDLRAVLAPGEAPPARLRLGGARPSILGHNTWSEWRETGRGERAAVFSLDKN